MIKLILNKEKPTSGPIEKMSNRCLDVKIIKGPVSIKRQHLGASYTDSFQAGRRLERVDLSEVLTIEFLAVVDAELEYRMYP